MTMTTPRPLAPLPGWQCSVLCGTVQQSTVQPNCAVQCSQTGPSRQTPHRRHPVAARPLVAVDILWRRAKSVSAVGILWRHEKNNIFPAVGTLSPLSQPCPLTLLHPRPPCWMPPKLWADGTAHGMRSTSTFLHTVPKMVAYANVCISIKTDMRTQKECIQLRRPRALGPVGVTFS